MTVGADCLLVNPQWVRGIFGGWKTLEVRGNNNIPLYKWIGVCETGTHIVYGAVMFSHCFSIDNEGEWNILRYGHRVDNPFSDVKYKTAYAWPIFDVWKYIEPVRVVYKSGQVVFMKDPEIREIFKGNQRVSLLNKFYRECQEWGNNKHFLSKGGKASV